MSDGEHTPGPWAAFTDDAADRPHTNIVAVKDRTAAVLSLPGRRKSEPDIRLVSAAPELLHALRTTLNIWVALARSGDAGNWDPEEEEHVIQARAAIAKATSLPTQ